MWVARISAKIIGSYEVLQVDGVEYEYDHKPVLSGVDLSVGDGEMVGIVGPNGCGKTTLMRLISGVLKPSKGLVKIMGEDVSRIKPRDRACLVAVVPQNPPMPVGYSVSDLVLMGRNAHMNLLEWEGPKDFEASLRAMDLTETAEFSQRVVRTLSGGERQRVVLAMALAQEAPLLLLDEPTASLDLSHQTKVMDLVLNLHGKRGGAVVIAMHDLTTAARYCNRLIMIAEGQVQCEGVPEEILTAENIFEVYGAEVIVLKDHKVGSPIVVGLGVKDQGSKNFKVLS